MLMHVWLLCGSYCFALNIVNIDTTFLLIHMAACCLHACKALFAMHILANYLPEWLVHLCSTLAHKVSKCSFEDLTLNTINVVVSVLMCCSACTVAFTVLSCFARQEW